MVIIITVSVIIVVVVVVVVVIMAREINQKGGLVGQLGVSPCPVLMLTLER